MRVHRRWQALGLLVITVACGLVWRLGPLPLSPFAYKYGGSALWAIAVYWVVVVVLPIAKPVRLAWTAALIATAVEVFKLLNWPPLDRFRMTLAGKLLLGRYFTFRALVAYWIAIAAAVTLDDVVGPRLQGADHSQGIPDLPRTDHQKGFDQTPL